MEQAMDLTLSGKETQRLPGRRPVEAPGRGPLGTAVAPQKGIPFA